MDQMSGPPRKKPRLTQTTKAHRFETFNQRISKIKIDPVHTVQKTRITEDHNDLSKSFFRSALEEWAELNLTSTFTSFLNKTTPLAESLPQILHHADTIFEILLEHIEKKDEIALEPLLSLAAHLAHDLGQQFSKYFEKTITSITTVSVAIDDPVAIENCFTCLAWIFKYMSKSLVQDLRPLFEIMIRYMSSKKAHVRRFTAESLAYLIRKASTLYTRNQVPLKLAIRYLFDQLGTAKKGAGCEMYENALMSLLTESVSGVEARLHPTATSVYGCAINVVGQELEHVNAERAVAVLEGCTIALIHQTNASGFKPLFDLIVSELPKSTQPEPLHNKLLARLLMVLVLTRKGSRVGAWSSVIETIKPYEVFVTDSHENGRILTYIQTCAGIFHYAPMDQLLPGLNKLLDQIMSNLASYEFFTFCEIVAELGKQRFHDLLLPRLQQYILLHWSDGEAGLCYLLCRLYQKQLTHREAGSPGYLFSGSDWSRHIVSRLSSSRDAHGFPESISYYFPLIWSIQVARESEISEDLREVLSSVVNKALERSKHELSNPVRLALGWALTTLLQATRKPSALWTKLMEEQIEAFYMLPFLRSCSFLAPTLSHEIVNHTEHSHAVKTLVGNMLSDSTDIRIASLELLHHIGLLRSDDWLVESVKLLLAIISTPYSPSNARQLAMYFRKLPSRQMTVGHETLLRDLLPLFALGSLSQYHDQPREDLCEAIRLMAEDTEAEKTILDHMIQWLQSPGMGTFVESESKTDQRTDKTSIFECSNLRSIVRLTDDMFAYYCDAEAALVTNFRQAHELNPPRIPTGSRSLALQVLLQMTETSERRSRALIPVFLSISGGKTNLHVLRSDVSSSSHTISPDADGGDWILRDRKMFLELISKFGNPKVLYRSGEVYGTMIETLTNGNPEIRKLALTTIFNWKDATLKNYQDILFRVAEEKTATTELATLLGRNEETGSVKIQDRETVLPILLRLVFGQLIGRSSNHGSQESKRKTILRLLFRMEKNEVLSFLKIALGRLGEIPMSGGLDQLEDMLSLDIVSIDQQYGFLRMMISTMEVLQNQFAPYGQTIVSSVLYCTARACKNFDSNQDHAPKWSALTKSTRRAGLQCLTMLFQECPDSDWSLHYPLIFAHIIRPRLSNFAIDNAQGVSGLLQLIASWTSSFKLFRALIDYDDHLLQAIWSTLSGETVQDDVKIFVIEKIITPLTDSTPEDEIYYAAAARVLANEVNNILVAFSANLVRQPSKGLLESIATIIPKIASYVTSAEPADEALNVLITLLCQSNQRMQPHIKSNLLKAIHSLLITRSVDLSPACSLRLFAVISQFYNYFKDIPNRQLLGKILGKLCQSDSDTLKTVTICEDLNATSQVQLDEIDFEKRLSAYNAINEFDTTAMSRLQMLPVLHNLIFFSRSAEDFSIRSNSVTCLKHYLNGACSSVSDDVNSLIQEILLPALRKGVREDSESVRADFVALFGLAIKNLQHNDELQDMSGLLVGNDEEASFFNNILHIQQHRRIRAIRRLVQETEMGRIRPLNIAEYFLPLLEKFVSDTSSDDSANGTKGHSIAANVTLLQWVDWKIFRRYFRQYRQDLENAARSEKDAIRMLNSASDALIDAIRNQQNDSGVKSVLTLTLPSLDIVQEELKAGFIPRLAKFIHHKDEAEMSLRLPAAKIGIKLIKLLPEYEISSFATPIVLDISQILRSRAQEARDVARNTLADIVSLLGSSSLQFVLKQLRTILTRGYQLHVLSYTLHTLLRATLNDRKPSDLDYCVDDLIAVVMDDIFGIVGQEKENQDYISSMKEVKSSKSFDTMELLAQSTGVKTLSKLITPFKSLLTGTLTTRQIRHVDDLLRRIGVGISHNPAASSQDLLIFAYEMIQAFYHQKLSQPAPALTNDQKNRQRYLVQLDSTQKTTSAASSSLLFKLARFALDTVRSTMLKHPSLLTASNVHGFLPIIGDAIVQGQEDVKISAFRLLSTVIKLPLDDLDSSSSLYIAEAVKVVKDAISMSEELPQAALKLVTSVLRDRKGVNVRESDLAYLLHRTMPDLEEPDRQGIVFNFIKSVMARQFQLPEVYEIVDKIGTMMVTNQTQNARDTARGVYVHFLLDYPQSEKRWSKQIKFLVKNLDYQHQEGRRSVLEAIYALLQKINKTKARDMISTFFIPAVLRMANDDHIECREMAGALISQMFRKSEASQLESLLTPLKDWVEQTDNSSLIKLSLQAWNLFFEANIPDAHVEVTTLRSRVGRLLRHTEGEDIWEIHFHALELLLKLTSRNPELIMSSKQRDMWSCIFLHLRSSHTWVQSSAVSLVDVFLQDCMAHGPNQGAFTSSHGMKVDNETILGVFRDCIKLLKVNVDSEELASKTMKILLALAMSAHSKGLDVKVKVVTPLISTSDVEGDADDSDGPAFDESETYTKSISAVDYCVDQMTRVLRQEPKKFTSRAFLPRLSALQMLTVLISQLPASSLSQKSVADLLMPLSYITAAETIPPRSVDMTFAETYKTYNELAQLLLEAIQSKLGVVLFVKLMTDASKIMRLRREERRQKRIVERIAEPEKAARDKRRKVDRKKERRKEINDIHRKGRRRDLGF